MYYRCKFPIGDAWANLWHAYVQQHSFIRAVTAKGNPVAAVGHWETAKNPDPTIDSDLFLFILLNVWLVLAFISYKPHLDWSQRYHRVMLIL